MLSRRIRLRLPEPCVRRDLNLISPLGEASGPACAAHASYSWEVPACSETVRVQTSRRAKVRKSREELQTGVGASTYFLMTVARQRGVNGSVAVGLAASAGAENQQHPRGLGALTRERIACLRSMTPANSAYTPLSPHASPSCRSQDAPLSCCPPITPSYPGLSPFAAGRRVKLSAPRGAPRASIILRGRR